MTVSPAPHVVMLVNNDVVRDTRVKKEAVALAAAGLRVTVVGITDGETRTEARLGDVRLLRVPVRSVIADSLAARRRRRRDWHPLPGPRSPREATGTTQYWQLRVADAVAQAATRGSGSPVHRGVAVARIAAAKAGRRAAGLRVRVADGAAAAARAGWARWDAVRQRTTFAVDWRRTLPTLLDYERAFTRLLDELAPDVVHVHDVHMLAIGAHAVARRRQQGGSVRLVYDAHEYVAGEAVYGNYTPRVVAAYRHLERSFIGLADLVITVSPQIAVALALDNRLPAEPVVVLNAPTRYVPADADTEAVSVRHAAGVADSTPLLVYSGNLTPVRGIEAMIDALAALPGVHLALVVPHRINRYGQSLLDRARDHGVEDRLHVVAPVESHLVSRYLSSATAGVHGLLHFPSHDMALPNKLFEYIHAGLPLVVSDVPAMAEFVRAHSLGEVYRAGDADDLAAAVRRLLPDTDRVRARLDAGGLAAEFSWERQAETLRFAYAELLGHPLPAPTTEPAGVVLHDVPVARLRPVLVGIGPSNSAGQAQAWATALQRHAGVAAESLAVTFTFAFPADHVVSRESFADEQWKAQWQRHVLETWTHALLETGRPVLGAGRGPHFSRDAAVFAAHGIEVGLVFHGSEIRSPRRHRLLHPDSPFRDRHDDFFALLQRQVDELAPLVAQFEGPKFVTTVDLLDDIPEAVWLPLVVDVGVWQPSPEPVLVRERPVVVHAPTNPVLKGTATIEPVLEGLHREGRIDYRRLTGLAPDQMHGALASADIVLDQFAIGNYGTLAVESMACGRLVVCNVDDRSRTLLPELPPLVSSRPRDLGETIRGLLEDRDGARSIAARGPDYVARWHDGKRSAQILVEHLGLGGR